MIHIVRFAITASLWNIKLKCVFTPFILHGVTNNKLTADSPSTNSTIFHIKLYHWRRFLEHGTRCLAHFCKNHTQFSYISIWYQGLHSLNMVWILRNILLSDLIFYGRNNGLDKFAFQNGFDSLTQAYLSVQL